MYDSWLFPITTNRLRQSDITPRGYFCWRFLPVNHLLVYSNTCWMIWFASPTAIRQDNNSHLLWRPVESNIVIWDFSARIKWPTSPGHITVCQWLVKYQMFLKLNELKVKVCTSVAFWVFDLNGQNQTNCASIQKITCMWHYSDIEFASSV